MAVNKELIAGNPSGSVSTYKN